MEFETVTFACMHFFTKKIPFHYKLHMSAQALVIIPSGTLIYIYNKIKRERKKKVPQQHRFS